MNYKSVCVCVCLCERVQYPSQWNTQYSGECPHLIGVHRGGWRRRQGRMDTGIVF